MCYLVLMFILYAYTGVMSSLFSKIIEIFSKNIRVQFLVDCTRRRIEEIFLDELYRDVIRHLKEEVWIWRITAFVLAAAVIIALFL